MLRPYVGGDCKAGGACLSHLRIRRPGMDNAARACGWHADSMKYYFFFCFASEAGKTKEKCICSGSIPQWAAEPSGSEHVLFSLFLPTKSAEKERKGFWAQPQGSCNRHGLLKLPLAKMHEHLYH